MNIIIVGDGKVGYALAELLDREHHDITVIDKDPEALRRAGDALDIMTALGNGASMRVLKEAGVENADVLIATTISDELNMICCVLGKRLGARHTVARIRDRDYFEEDNVLLRETLDIDMIINPEWAAAGEIARLLRMPAALNIDILAWGRVELVTMKLQEGEPMVGVTLASLRKKIPPNLLICAVERGDEVIIPKGDTVLRAGDLMYLLGDRSGMIQLVRFLRRDEDAVLNTMVVGGGRISYYLAKILEKTGMRVKIIEIDEHRCRELDEALPHTILIHGDGTDHELMASENLDEMDAFVALTDLDEENLIAALYAKKHGVPKIITKITRTNNLEIINDLGIGSIVTPKLLVTDSILRFVRSLESGHPNMIETLVQIVGGKVEVLEFIADANPAIVDIPLERLPIRQGMLVAVIHRGRRLIFPRGKDIIETGDHVIVICALQKQRIDALSGILES